MGNLQVGDKIVQSLGGGQVRLYGTVERVTATQAIVYGTRFKREYDNGRLSVTRIGGSGFYSYRLATEDDFRDIEHRRKVRAIQDFRFIDHQGLTAL